MMIVLRYKIPTIIYELYVRSRITTGLLYSIFGLKVPDDGTITFYREIKLKMGFGVVHCCYYSTIKFTCNSWIWAASDYNGP